MPKQPSVLIAGTPSDVVKNALQMNKACHREISCPWCLNHSAAIAMLSGKSFRFGKNGCGLVSGSSIIMTSDY
jgi:hypothetical protein